MKRKETLHVIHKNNDEQYSQKMNNKYDIQ